jgi:hypothetical protein
MIIEIIRINMKARAIATMILEKKSSIQSKCKYHLIGTTLEYPLSLYANPCLYN